ncbi:MAG: SLC13/DASS family transporter [Halioglobus sp.]|nr:SLC13/DASS family transporter [Halioglobus sp.]
MKILTTILGPVLALVSGAMSWHSGAGMDIACTTTVLVWCAIWWIFEPIPIPATSLIPIIFLPAFGVITPGQLGEAIGSPIILLLMGGFFLSTALTRSGAHRRIAIMIVRRIGLRPRLIVIGFMIAAASLSMWISNVATTLMLVPIALAAIESNESPEFRATLLLAVAYAASVGGIGTPIGTTPNLIFLQVLDSVGGETPGFLEWMTWTLPIVVIMLPLMAWWLTRNISDTGSTTFPELGPWRPEEIRTLTIFALTAAAWVFRKEPFGGWTDMIGLPAINDASIALAAVLIMFLVPNGKGGGQRLLNWETAEAVPWGTLILFAGGLALAKGFTVSGLDQLIGGSLGFFATLPPPVLVFGLCLLVTFLTEVTSNTATTALLMPVLAAVAVGSDLPPALLMAPAAISASFAFMLPVATGPNAIVYGTGTISTGKMAREGFVLNLLGAGVIGSVMLFVFYW